MNRIFQSKLSYFVIYYMRRYLARNYSINGHAELVQQTGENSEGGAEVPLLLYIPHDNLV